MNKSLLLDWLLENVARHADEKDKSPEEVNLEDVLFELNNRREIALPSALPRRPDKMLPVLRKHFKDNVTFISLVLNYHFPRQYIFYRVSKLEPEIFEGFEFFSDVAPMLTMPFPHVGRKGINRYLKLNEALLQFVQAHWPGQRNPQAQITYFLYQGLGELFVQKSDYNRYWIVATKEPYHDSLDAKDQIIGWSGRKEMRSGDLVFTYRMAPRKAITDILRVKDTPSFDPWGAWDGFWVNLEKVCRIDDITFAEMRNDPALSQWGLVRRNFIGTVTEPVPHSVYNWILERLPAKTRTKHGLTPEPVVMAGSFTQFVSEADFEDQAIESLLKRWGFAYQRQYSCRFRVGSQYYQGRVDFHVSDENGPLTLFEDKSRILNDADLALAVDQAKSYALLLGLPSFVVASPEGLWLYSLLKNEEKLVGKIAVHDVSQRQEEEFRSAVLKLRDNS